MPEPGLNAQTQNSFKEVSGSKERKEEMVVMTLEEENKEKKKIVSLVTLLSKLISAFVSTQSEWRKP